jgi:hypothetical protein
MSPVNTWSATLESGTLMVNGEYTFPTTGYKVHLAKREPQGFNPEVLLLEKVVVPPTGIVADHFVTIPVSFEERTATRYQAVEILPDATIIRVTHAG